MKAISDHLEEYQQKGFTIFPGLYDQSQMQRWREKHAEWMADYDQRTWFGNVLEYAPKLMWPAVSQPILLDFLEQVMGPFVQLDNLTLAVFPSIAKKEAKSQVSGWHRDRWAHLPQEGIYTSPLASNAISYLQDLTDDSGPLRVIVGSHCRAVTIEEGEARSQPHSEESLIYMKAGDVIVTHNGLIHSGTPNTSGQLRYLFSIYYNSSWLKHTDNHSGPLTQHLLVEARKRKNYRQMRLLGEDPQMPGRCNSGFLVPDQQRWQQWIESDRQALVADN